MSTSDCLFCGIAAGDLSADIVYENEHVLAFQHPKPTAEIHVAVIPRKHGY